MNWCDGWERWCSNTVYLAVCSECCDAWGAQVCYFQQRACRDIFLMLIRLLLLLLQVRAPPFTCRWLLNMYLPCTRERGQKVRRRKVGVISSSTWFATDGYCLEFQGRDLMLCSPSISCRLWINQMKHKLLYCKYSNPNSNPIRLQATANVNWNHITSATGRDTCDYSCSRELFGRLIFYTWRDFYKHLASSVCDRGRLPPLSFDFVYFAANQSGYPVGVCCLSSASVIPANQHRWCSEGASRRSFC